MNDKSNLDPITLNGPVSKVDLSGIGPNSGELTLVISVGQDNVAVFAGILPGENGLEPAVYASYVNMALTAYAKGVPLTCEYLTRDKPRIYKLRLPADKS